MNKSPRIYGSKWDRERLLFLRTHPLCAMCHEQGRVTAATVVDHIIPHKLKEALNSGNAEAIAKAQKLFWSRKNWQGLCKQHHETTQASKWGNNSVVSSQYHRINNDRSPQWELLLRECAMIINNDAYRGLQLLRWLVYPSLLAISMRG